MDPLGTGAPEPSQHLWQAGASSAFGIIAGTINPDGSIEQQTVRTAASVGDIFDLDATAFFAQAPCDDCVTVTAIGTDPDTGHLALSVGIRHPFGDELPRRDLHIFDVRGILILPGTKVFNVLTAPINTNLTDIETQSLQGDPEFVTNADGFTTHFDYRAEDPRYVPNPVPVPGNFNAFKRYFENSSTEPFSAAAPAGWNVLAMGEDFEVRTYLLDRAKITGLIPFAFVVDARWGQAAEKATRTTPSYYLPAFNRQEAWFVEAEVTNNNLQAGDATSTASIEVTVKDWQASSTVTPNFPNPAYPDQVPWAGDVDRVDVLVPGVSALDTATDPASGGGSPDNPYVYALTINNDLLAGQGTYVGLVAVRDALFTLQGPEGLPATVGNLQGLDVKDYSTYNSFTLTLGTPVDDPPVADASDTAPTSVVLGEPTTLDGSASADDMGIVKYEWNPGDGGGYVDNGTNPSLNHNYSLLTNEDQHIYTATLRVTDTVDQQSTDTIDITVSRETDNMPVAFASAQPTNPISGQLVTLSGMNSTDDFGITRYRWNPGDGTGWVDRGSSPTMTHQYSASVGTTYTAILEVTDTSSQVDTDNVQVSVSVPNDPPIADPSLTEPTSGASPLQVMFDGSDSSDDQGIVKFEWDPGDGSGYHDQGTIATFQHTYSPIATTTFDAMLRVTDAGGLTDVSTIPIEVTASSSCQLTGINGPGALNVGETITLTAQGSAAVYEWTETSGALEFVGPTNESSVDVRAIAPSATVNDLTVYLNAANVNCGESKTLTAYGVAFTSPSSTRRQYVNWEGGTGVGEGRTVNATVQITPSKTGTAITLGFTDPDEPEYGHVTGQSWTQGGDVAAEAETDTNDNDNVGDDKRPNGSSTGGAYQVGYSTGTSFTATRAVNSSATGSASAAFQVSRYGGDNYYLSATCDPAGNGSPVTVSSPLITVYRRYMVPVFSMENSAHTNEWFYKPAVDQVNAHYQAAYIEITNLSNGFGGLAYQSPLTPSASAQFAYLEADATYDFASEKYSPVIHGQMSCGIDRYTNAGTIGLWSGTYNPSKLPPTGLDASDKPYLNRNYFTVALGRMMDFWSGATLDTLGNHVFCHELGHSLGLPHNHSTSPTENPPVTKHGESGIGIMAPSSGPGVKDLFTMSELQFLRGADTVGGEVFRGPYYE